MISLLPPKARFDLHTHSSLSDGKLPPAEVVRRAAAGGLDVLALTDHDLAPTVRSGRHQIGRRVLHVLHGAEISGTHDGVEYHLLVFFPHEMPEAFRDFCRARSQHRAERYANAVERLSLDGLPAPDDDAWAGRRALTRYHLSRAIVAAGHAPDLRAAFDRYTGSRHGLVPKVDLTFTEAIRQARAAGGITSWAHPPLDAARRWVAEFAAAGLQGLEALRPQTSRGDQNAFRKLAREHGLFLTGGSDWHGWRPKPLGEFAVRRRDLRGFIEALEVARAA